MGIHSTHSTQVFYVYFQIVIILRGLPGSGKSHVAKLIKVPCVHVLTTVAIDLAYSEFRDPNFEFTNELFIYFYIIYTYTCTCTCHSFKDEILNLPSLFS